MLESLTIYDSFIQRLDPRIKIISVFIFSILAAVSQKFSVLLLAFSLSLAAFFAARIPIKEAIKRFIPVNTLVIFLWFFLPFTFKGNTVFTLFDLPVTLEGILLAAMITVKSNVIMLMLIALTLSTPIVTIAHAMHEMKMPKNIVHLFFFTLRYIHVIHNEYIRLSNSMKIRSFKPKTNFHTYRTYAYMVGMLLVKSLERAQRVHNAMRCRGFNGNLYRLSNFSIQKTDKIVMAIMMILFLILGIIEWKAIPLF